MPWPGSPKSQQSPAINPPSMRFPNALNEHSSMSDVADAMKTAFDGLTVHEQAFANLPAQIASQAATAATSAVSSSSSSSSSSGVATAAVSTFNSRAGDVIFFPSLGLVNDQLGNPAYYTQNSDSGKKIIVGTDSTVNVVFNSNVNVPWFTIIDNDSSGIAYLFADSGAVYGAQFIPDSGFGIVFFDGANFWAGATAVSGGGSGLPVNNPTFTGTMTGPHYAGNGGIGSIVPGTGTGTGASVAIVTADDARGSFSVNVGTSLPPTGSVAVITFATPYASTPAVVISALDSNTAGGEPFIQSISPTGFSIWFNTPGSPSSGSTYTFSYLVMG